MNERINFAWRWTMVLDPSTLATQPNVRTERPEPYANVTSETNSAQPARPEAGQTSEVGPDVVTDFSAAALEASRTATPPNQTADQNATENGVRASEERSPEERRPPTERERAGIDVVV
jgi:hypothetical protein